MVGRPCDCACRIFDSLKMTVLGPCWYAWETGHHSQASARRRSGRARRSFADHVESAGSLESQETMFFYLQLVCECQYAVTSKAVTARG